ncbi:hypothetical protein ACFQX6_56755 [Streptosporangium lutulentum]
MSITPSVRVSAPVAWEAWAAMLALFWRAKRRTLTRWVIASPGEYARSKARTSRAG